MAWGADWGRRATDWSRRARRSRRRGQGERLSLRRMSLEACEPRAMLASDLQDGGLKMEAIAAYNLVVDSNAETPATYAPNAAHLGVRVTNTGSTTLTDIVIRMGDLTNASTGAGTAGIYPVTVIAPSDPRDYDGSFSLQQEGGLSEATRLIPSLAPGESTVAYVLVSYPALDANGKNVTGAASVTADDLVFNYDIWVQATEGSTARLVYDERSITARNELSALANKIRPNTTSKVPTEYLDAIQASLGWRPTGSARVPGAVVSEGIWYDFGTVVKGFDNDGDLLPDYNAWIQPVGDATRYDASAQRMVKTYGLLIVKLRDGTEKLMPFEDQLYFQNLPENNTGVVGLVFYEFLPTQYGVASALTPYQEVASGADNEKFNGDFGASGGLLTFAAPNVAFDKTGPASLTLTSPTGA